MKIRNLILVLVLMVGFLVVINTASADGCCLKTLGEQYCVNQNDGASQYNCMPGSWQDKNCDQVQSCVNKGCCYQSGVCDEGSSEQRCVSNSGEFNLGSCDYAPNCQKVCCKVNLGYSYISEARCNSVSGTVQEGINDEPNCEALNNGVDGQRVCCVSGDGECSRILNDKCSEIGGTAFSGFYCRDVSLCNPKCIGRHHTGSGQVGDEVNRVYWYDSCGNQEDLVDEGDPAEAFRAIGLEPFNGDCSFNPAKALAIADNEQFTCADLVCKNVWDNPYTDENHDDGLTNDNFFGVSNINPSLGGQTRDFRYNGESWCQYQQAKVGPGLDLPGTRHYRHYCDRGIERVDDGGISGRDKICIEEIKTEQNIGADGRIHSFAMSNADWIENDALGCLECNSENIRSENKTQECCLSKNQCAFLLKKNILGKGKSIILLEKSEWDKVKDLVDDANKFLKIRYWNGDNLVKEDDFKSTVEGWSSCVETADSGLCRLTLNNPPIGDYRLTIYGKGCEDLGVTEYCETDEVDLGLRLLNLEGKGGVASNICVPLVPPSNNEFCEVGNELIVSTLREGIGYGHDVKFKGVNAARDLYYYYTLSYNTFGLGDNCKDIFDCMNKFNSTVLYNPRVSDYSYERGKGAVLSVIDNTNSLCRTLGDCGNAPNLLRKVYSSGTLYFIPEWGADHISPTTRDRKFWWGSRGYDVYISRNDIEDLEDSKFDNLRSGKPIRPENYTSYAWFFLPLGLFSKLKRKKTFRNFYIGLLLILILVLYGCTAVSTYDPVETSVSCSSWQPPLKSEDCWKCNKQVSDGGLLLDVNLTLSNGLPVYTCTEDLCNSLGRCRFISGENICEAKQEFALPRIEFSGANFTCNNLDAAGCRQGNIAMDNHATKPTLGIPGKLEENTALTISFITVAAGRTPDEVSTRCEYSDKEDMSNPSDIDGGRVLTKHDLQFDILAAKDLPYNFYIRCVNEDEESAQLAKVTFSVAQGNPTGEPIIAQILPDGSNYVKYGDTTKNVQLYVRGRIDHCRWDKRNVAFANMGNITSVRMVGGREIIESTALTIFNCNAAGVCSVTLQNVSVGDNKYWFACRGVNGKVSQPYPSEGFLIKGTEQLNITDVNCVHSLGNNCDKIYDNNFNFSVRTIGGAENGNARCRWTSTEFDYSCFSDPGCEEGILPQAKISNLHRQYGFSGDGVIDLRFTCIDTADNLAEKTMAVNVERDLSAPRILKINLENENLNVLTNEIATCKYADNRNILFGNMTNFDSTENTLHITSFMDKDYMRVSCSDRFDHVVSVDVYRTKLSS